MRVRVETAAALSAILEDAQARRLAGDTSVTLNDIVRAISAARRAVRDLGIDRKRAPEEQSLAGLLRADREAQMRGETSDDEA
jgi:hypothetical protein